MDSSEKSRGFFTRLRSFLFRIDVQDNQTVLVSIIVKESLMEKIAFTMEIINSFRNEPILYELMPFENFNSSPKEIKKHLQSLNSDRIIFVDDQLSQELKNLLQKQKKSYIVTKNYSAVKTEGWDKGSRNDFLRKRQSVYTEIEDMDLLKLLVNAVLEVKRSFPDLILIVKSKNLPIINHAFVTEYQDGERIERVTDILHVPENANDDFTNLAKITILPKVKDHTGIANAIKNLTGVIILEKKALAAPFRQMYERNLLYRLNTVEELIAAISELLDPDYLAKVTTQSLDLLYMKEKNFEESVLAFVEDA